MRSLRRRLRIKRSINERQQHSSANREMNTCLQVALRVLEAAKAVGAAQFLLVSPAGSAGGGGGFLGGLFGGGAGGSSQLEQACRAPSPSQCSAQAPVQHAALHL